MEEQAHDDPSDWQDATDHNTGDLVVFQICTFKMIQAIPTTVNF